VGHVTSADHDLNSDLDPQAKRDFAGPVTFVGAALLLLAYLPAIIGPVLREAFMALALLAVLVATYRVTLGSTGQSGAVTHKPRGQLIARLSAMLFVLVALLLAMGALQVPLSGVALLVPTVLLAVCAVYAGSSADAATTRVLGLWVIVAAIGLQALALLDFPVITDSGLVPAFGWVSAGLFVIAGYFFLAPTALGHPEE